MITVCVFTLEGCPYCDDLKSRLQKEGIEYVEYSIEEHKNLWDQIVNKLNHDFLPTVFLKNNENRSGVVLMPNITVENEDDMIQKIRENT